MRALGRRLLAVAVATVSITAGLVSISQLETAPLPASAADALSPGWSGVLIDREISHNSYSGEYTNGPATTVLDDSYLSTLTVDGSVAPDQDGREPGLIDQSYLSLTTVIETSRTCTSTYSTAGTAPANLLVALGATDYSLAAEVDGEPFTSFHDAPAAGSSAECTGQIHVTRPVGYLGRQQAVGCHDLPGGDGVPDTPVQGDPNNPSLPGGYDGTQLDGTLTCTTPYGTLSAEWHLTRLADGDHDGIANATDNCPTTSNFDQSDIDHDGTGDACESGDADHDGVADSDDRCPTTPANAVVDEHGCAPGEAGQDTDGDGVPDGSDGCPATPPQDAVDGNGCALPCVFRPGSTGVVGVDPNSCFTMVALGDSFSSGEGAYDYQPGTNVSGVNHCHRSLQSYPFVANGFLNGADQFADVVSFACSGATVKDLSIVSFCGSGCDHGHFEPPQLDQLKALAETSPKPIGLVTIGIGGNDGGFADVLTGCIEPGNCVEKFDPTVGGKPAGDSVASIGAAISAELDNIHRLVPQARIVLVGYPVFMDGAYKDCPARFGADESEWIRGQILTMNRELEATADFGRTNGGLDIDFLSLDDVYGHHAHCNGGSTDDWLHTYEVNAPGGGTCIGQKVEYKKVGVADVICNESFHPTATGHQATGVALANCVRFPATCGRASDEQVRTASKLVGPANAAPIACIGLLPVPPAGATCFLVTTGAGTWLEHQVVQVVLHSDSVELSPVTSESDGSLKAYVIVPPGTVAPGDHQLSLIGEGDDTIIRVAHAPVLIGPTGASPDAPPADVPAPPDALLVHPRFSG